MTVCFFCHGEASLTREHLFSRPICRVAGIDRRSSQMAGLDGHGRIDRSPRPVDQWTVRLPCKVCNEGWMSRLEGEVADHLKRWAKRPCALGETGARALRRWMLKNYFVMAFQDADLRRPLLEDEFGRLVYNAKVPFEATRARLLSTGDERAFDDVVVGAARVSASTIYATGFGNPSVEANAADWNCRTAGVAAVALAGIQVQLWVVAAPLRPRAVRLPRNVSRLTAQTRLHSLGFATDRLDPTAVWLSYGG